MDFTNFEKDKQEYQNFRDQVEELKDKKTIENLQSKVEDQDKSIKILEQRVYTLKTTNTDLEEVVKELKTKVEKL